MAPIRIKLYGLLWLTRRGYLMQLAVSAALLVVLFVLWLSWLPATPAPSPGVERPPGLRLALLLLGNLHWVLLAAAVLCSLEAWYVLRRFARAEAEQRVQSMESYPQP